MELIKASKDEHWEIASSLLTQTVERCNKNGVPLWTYEQVKISSLKSSYSFESLYLLQHEREFVGCVFISFDYDVFWKDFSTQGSLFFHKLAIGDAHNSKGLGTLALAEILSLGKHLGCTCLRCD